MSADNWAVCPKCERDRVFDAKEATMREDYELGITEEGEFYIRYKAACLKCGFSHKFTHDAALLTPTEPR